MTEFIDLVKTTTTDHEKMEIIVVLKEFPKAKLIVHTMNFMNNEFTYSVGVTSWFPPHFKKALEFMSGSHNAAPYLYEVAKVAFGDDLKGLKAVVALVARPDNDVRLKTPKLPKQARGFKGDLAEIVEDVPRPYVSPTGEPETDSEIFDGDAAYPLVTDVQGDKH